MLSSLALQFCSRLLVIANVLFVPFFLSIFEDQAHLSCVYENSWKRALFINTRAYIPKTQPHFLYVWEFYTVFMLAQRRESSVYVIGHA